MSFAEVVFLTVTGTSLLFATVLRARFGSTAVGWGFDLRGMPANEG